MQSSEICLGGRKSAVFILFVSHLKLVRDIVDIYILASPCVFEVFDRSNLASIDVSFTAWNLTDATTIWVNSVAASGIFTCLSTLPKMRATTISHLDGQKWINDNNEEELDMTKIQKIGADGKQHYYWQYTDAEVAKMKSMKKMQSKVNNFICK